MQLIRIGKSVGVALYIPCESSGVFSLKAEIVLGGAKLCGITLIPVGEILRHIFIGELISFTGLVISDRAYLNSAAGLSAPAV